MCPEDIRFMRKLTVHTRTLIAVHVKRMVSFSTAWLHHIYNASLTTFFKYGAEHVYNNLLVTSLSNLFTPLAF